MNSTGADLARLLARAAELRAGGSSWEHVAETLRRSVATCRRWPQKYPDVWRRAYAAAAYDRLAEAGAEGLRKLREMLRSEDAKTRQSAAKTLAALLPRTCRSDDSGREGQTDGGVHQQIEGLIHGRLVAVAHGPTLSPHGPAAERREIHTQSRHSMCSRSAS